MPTDSIPRRRPAASRADKRHCTESITIAEGAGDAVVNPGPQPFGMDPTARQNTRQRRCRGTSTRRPKPTGNRIDGQEKFWESGLSAFGITGLEQ